MQGLRPTPPPQPITARAAENGLYLSVYICVLVLAAGLSVSSTLAVLVVFAGSVAMPFFVYKLLSKSNDKCGGALGFPELWAEGIASFFLGTLLPALLAYVLLRFVAPTFLYNVVTDSIEIIKNAGTPSDDAMLVMLEQAVEKGAVPSPADIAAQIISFNIIVGTFMSFFTALWVNMRSISRKAKKQ